MKIAFLISAHTDAKQLHRLVDALPDGSQNIYILMPRATFNSLSKNWLLPRVCTS